MSLSVCALLMACGGDKTTGKACLGSNNDTLVEGMQDKCKAGDIVATKHPAYFCDFNYAVTFNSYNYYTSTSRGYNRSSYRKRS